mmetsp:Transcript_23975/g.51286  ORF Transcript_23975/g.51286 Transcript_23975/m.51286 type:complete len:235 (-) Transcript_23975:83-787(-)
MRESMSMTNQVVRYRAHTALPSRMTSPLRVLCSVTKLRSMSTVNHTSVSMMSGLWSKTRSRMRTWVRYAPSRAQSMVSTSHAILYGWSAGITIHHDRGGRFARRASRRCLRSSFRSLSFCRVLRTSLAARCPVLRTERTGLSTSSPALATALEDLMVLQARNRRRFGVMVPSAGPPAIPPSRRPMRILTSFARSAPVAFVIVTQCLLKWSLVLLRLLPLTTPLYSQSSLASSEK